MFSLPFVVSSHWTEVTKRCSVLYHCFHPLTWSISIVTLHHNWISEIKSEISFIHLLIFHWKEFLIGLMICFPISLLLVVSKSGSSSCGCCCCPPLKSPEDHEEIQEATTRADAKEWSTGSCFKAGWHVNVKKEQKNSPEGFFVFEENVYTLLQTGVGKSFVEQNSCKKSDWSF